MPKTRFQDHISKTKPVDVAAPNYVNELMRRYMKAQKMTSSDVGEALSITGGAVRHMLNRPASAWSINELQRYCKVLNIPLADALKAAALGVNA